MNEIPVIKLDLPEELDEIFENNQISLKERKKIYEILSKRSSNERGSNFNMAMRLVQQMEKKEIPFAISFVRQCTQILLFDGGNCRILVEPPFNAVAYLFSTESGGAINLVEFEKKGIFESVSKEDIVSFVRGDQQKEMWKEILPALQYFISGGHPK